MAEINIREHIKEKLSLVPKKPGCYQMRNAEHEIIYVGKAKVLQNRLKSYFTGSHDAKTTRMLQDVVDFEYIITSSEVEAFLLELNFIKEHRPKYNIMLMDDKTYPYIYLTAEENPRLMMTRDVKKTRRKKGQKLFGPFPNAKACRDTVEMLNKVYPFRKCNHIPKKSCLYYDMGQCLAPCIHSLKRSDYEAVIHSATKFLNGNNAEMIATLEKRMQEAAASMEFEKAIEYRDILKNMEELASPQAMTLNDGITRDIFGYYMKDGLVCVQVLHMRRGKIMERSGEVFDVFDNLEEIVLSYIYQFYDGGQNIVPQEVLLPFIEGAPLLEELLGVRIIVPVKGLKKKLVTLVCENAQTNLDNLQKMRLIKLGKTKEPLEELAQLLQINYPKVIELFDNSNIQGASPVSAMVAYVDGVRSPKDYRKYKVKTVEGADDYHTMQEVIERRYTRIIKEGTRKPNLIIVDGGKIQVNAASLILNQLKVTDIDLIGLLKDDQHKTRGIVTRDAQEIILDKKSNIYLLLEAMQDEVHRFAITFFKQTHSKNSLASVLDDIEGIGKNRKKILMQSYDSIADIMQSSIERLKALGFPEQVARNLLETLKNRDQSEEACIQ